MNPVLEFLYLVKIMLQRFGWFLALIFVFGFFWPVLLPKLEWGSYITENKITWLAALIMAYLLSRSYKLCGDSHSWMAKPFRNYLIGPSLIVVLVISIILPTLGLYLWLVYHGANPAYCFRLFGSIDLLISLIYAGVLILFFSFSSTWRGLFWTFLAVVACLFVIQKVEPVMGNHTPNQTVEPQENYWIPLWMLLILFVATVFRFTYRRARLVCLMIVVIGFMVVDRLPLSLKESRKPSASGTELKELIADDLMLKLPEFRRDAAFVFEPLVYSPSEYRTYNFESQAYLAVGIEAKQPVTKNKGLIVDFNSKYTNQPPLQLGLLVECQASLVLRKKIPKRVSFHSDGYHIIKCSVQNRAGKDLLIIGIEAIDQSRYFNPSTDKYEQNEWFSFIYKNKNQIQFEKGPLDNLGGYRLSHATAVFDFEEGGELFVIVYRPVEKYKVLSPIKDQQ